MKEDVKTEQPQKSFPKASDLIRMYGAEKAAKILNNL
jgi:hypothetical protein